MLAWLRLVRLPNLATAAADPLAGCLVVSGLGSVERPFTSCLLAVLASVACYAAGVVINDVQDLELDRVERPERPLPSGAIAVRRAAFAGTALLAIGAAAACGAAVAARSPWPALVGVVLAGAIWIYDGHAKATPAGPAVMGSCRGLNWLLGMTAAGGPASLPQWTIPLGMTLYVAGITLVARDEAGRSRPTTLVRGMALMAAGLAVAAGFVWLPLLAGAGRVATLPAPTWLLLWAILAAAILLRVARAVIAPTPQRVRAAVGNAIMSIITLDAALVLAAGGERRAIPVLALLAWFLVGRRLAPPT